MWAPTRVSTRMSSVTPREVTRNIFEQKPARKEKTHNSCPVKNAPRIGFSE
jgi:hypothetical protein